MTIKAMSHIHPADLIKASLFNDIIDNISDLQTQLDGLHEPPASAAVEITDLIPAGDVREVTPLTIRGRNFAVPAVLNTVKFDAKAAAILAGSDTELMIDVPGGIPNLPGDKTLTVSNSQHGTATRTVHVVPTAIGVTGKIIVTDQSGSLGKILEDHPYTFTFELNAVNLNIAETFRVTAVFTKAVGVTTSDWDSNTTYSGTSGGDEHRITVSPNTKSTFAVVVTVPHDAKSVELRVDVKSLHNHPTTSSSSQAIPITVNQDQPVSTGIVSFTLGQPTSDAVNVVSIGSASGLEIEFAKNPIVQLNALYHALGTYVHELQLETDTAVPETGGPWQVTQVNPPSRGYNAETQDVLQFKIKAPGAPPADGLQRYVRMTVTRGALSTYFRFPVVGFTRN